MKKNIFILFLFLGFVSRLHSQDYSNDKLLGKFSYLLTNKPTKLKPDFIYNEIFSLQITEDRSFFISEILLERDSLNENIYDKEIRSDFEKFKNSGKPLMIDMRNKYLPKTDSNYLIIQENGKISFYTSIFMTKYKYVQEGITHWKLLDETKEIHSFLCKKAEVEYRGRKWTAWYVPEIPFPYGPAKFGGLPGLIVKITDATGDYDYELIKSTPNKALTDKKVAIRKRHYQKATLTTQKEMRRLREEFEDNRIQMLESMGTTITNKAEVMQQMRERDKQREENRKFANPLELTD